MIPITLKEKLEEIKHNYFVNIGHTTRNIPNLHGVFIDPFEPVKEFRFPPPGVIEAEKGKKKHLLNMTIVYLFSLFEGFIKDTLFEIYMHKPEIMTKRKRKLTWEEILTFESITAIHSYLANKLIDDFGYKNLDELSKEFQVQFNINLEEDHRDWASFRENYYRRNIIVHNQGKISYLYLEKMNVDPSQINTELLINEEYVKQCQENLFDAMTGITNSLLNKFS
ncbi:MAG: hypothetical protein ACFE96_17415 [Candidatus Hermodarchaeota archaeon]